MARAKPTSKPLFSLKQDFIDSLDRVTTEAIFLLQTIDTVLDEDLCPKVPPAVRQRLKERRDAFRATLSSED